MAIGERIHFFRTARGMTQKYLGQMVGFDEKSADVRIAQYETGTRSPKTDMTRQLAEQLDVAPEALSVPDIDTHTGLMHTLFALEDTRGLTIGEIDGEVCLRLDKHHKDYTQMFQSFNAWLKQKRMLQDGEKGQDEYDHWKYHFPEKDAGCIRVKVPAADILHPDYLKKE